MIAKCRVVASGSPTPSTSWVRLERPAGFDFLPVQFCGLELATDEGGVEYPMSLASSPTRPWLEFGARRSDSPWKRAFAALEPGDEVEVDGAYGHFVLDEDRDAVLVAGGIGITPLKGMAEYHADKRLPTRMTLLYSSRDENEIAFRAELDALAAADPRLRVEHTLTRPDASWTGTRGRIGPDALARAGDGLDAPKWYVCGRPEMVEDVLKALSAQDVAREDVLYERFTGYA